MRTLWLGVCALGLLASCGPELPPDTETVCMASQYSTVGCEDQTCIPKVQYVNLAPSSSDDWSVHFDCVECQYESTSTDMFPHWVQPLMARDDLVLFLRIDDRATVEPTLEKLRQYALDAHGWYTTAQGKMDFAPVPFEIVSYDEPTRSIHVRLKAPLHKLEQVFTVPPYPCEFMGTPTVCTKIGCYYDDEQPGSDGFTGELDMDIEARIDIYTPPP